MSVIRSRSLAPNALATFVLLALACSDGGGPTDSQPAGVATIAIAPTDLAMTVGESRQLSATPRDASGNTLTGRTVTWESTLSGVATVDGTGLVRAVAPGQAMIRATSEGKTAQTPVLVSAGAVATITVAPADPTIEVGATQLLTATLRDAAGNVLLRRTITWSSSDEAVATVAETGLVQGMAAGVATITATAEGKSGSTSVTVNAQAAVSSVTVSPNVLRLVRGATQTLIATPRDDAGNVLAGRSISWESSNAAVATVDATGAVLAVSSGLATITATAEGRVGSAEVTVSVVTFVSVATGGAHTCALTGSGIAYCWGRGESGQLGIPAPETSCPIGFPCSKVPVGVQGGIVFTQLTGGGSHTCGLTSAGTAYCWGDNRFGQLGDNGTTSRDTPTPVATGLSFAQIDAGGNHTCGITTAGVAHCWGENTRGQLGDGTTTSHSTPVPVAGGLIVQQIVAGGFANPGVASQRSHTCALTTAGDAYCWGNNDLGQLGNGGSGPIALNPAPVSGGLKFVALTAGLGDHTCGVTSAGKAYCWGANPFGALGNGSTGHSFVPVEVSGDLEFSQLSAGGFIGHTCGRTGNGDAYCWGDNEVGMVGDGTTVDRLVPTAVAGGHRFNSLDAGFRHTCGRTTTGAIYCWGSNGAGQLGDDSSTARSAPVKVVGQP